MEKLYYNADGWVCQRYPYDLPIENENMYIEVDNDTYNQTLQSVAGKAWKVENNQVILQIYDNKEYTKNLYLTEIETLKLWFNENYTVQEQKLRRLHTIGKNTDDGQDPYQALINLYNLAEVNRARIHELEALIA